MWDHPDEVRRHLEEQLDHAFGSSMSGCEPELTLGSPDEPEIGVTMFNKLPDEIRAGINTAFQAFLAAFLLLATGWLGDLTNWLQDGGEFPAVEPAVKTAAALVVGLVSGVASAVINWLKSKTARFSAATYAPPPPAA